MWHLKECDIDKLRFLSYLGRCSMIYIFWSPGYWMRHISAVMTMVLAERSTQFIWLQCPCWVNWWYQKWAKSSEDVLLQGVPHFNWRKSPNRSECKIYSLSLSKFGKYLKKIPFLLCTVIYLCSLNNTAKAFGGKFCQGWLLFIKMSARSQ